MERERMVHLWDYRFETLHLFSHQLASCLGPWTFSMAALREGLASWFFWEACPKLLALAIPVLNGKYACGLCIWRDLKLLELGNAEMHVEWISRCCALSWRTSWTCGAGDGCKSPV